MTRSDLAGLRLALLHQKELEPENRWVMISPDDVVRFEDVASVMSLAVRAGIADIALGGESLPRAIRDRNGVHEELSKKRIREVIQASEPELSRCYTQYLTHRPARVAAQPAERIEVKFSILETGAVQDTSVTQSTSTATEFHKCVLGVLQELKFPPPGGGGIVIVRYPLSFRPH